MRTRVLVSSLGGALAVIALVALPTDAAQSRARARDGQAAAVKAGSDQAAAPAGSYAIRALNAVGRGELNVFNADHSPTGTIRADADGIYHLVATPGSTVLLSNGVNLVGGPSDDVVKVVLPVSSLTGEFTVDFAPAVPASLEGPTTSVGGPDSCTPTLIPSISPISYTDSGTTVGGGASSGLPSCGSVGAGSADVWYTFTATASTGVTASLCAPAGSATYDSAITVYELCADCAPAELICVATNDDFCGLQTQVSWSMTVGDTVLIRVHGFATAQGSYVLNVSATGTGPNPICPIPAGACCLTGPSSPLNCINSIEEAVCTTAGGAWAGEDIVCVEDTSANFATDVPSGTFGEGGAASADAHVIYTAPGDCCLITDMDALVHLHHSFIGDLQLDITSPAATTIRVWGGACGASANLHMVADDTGANPATVLCTSVTAEPPSESFADYVHVDTNGPPPVFGAFGGVENFEGQNTCAAGGTATGTWTLHANDTFNITGGGVITNFGLLAAGCGEIIENCPASPCAAGDPTSGPTSTP